MRCSLMPRGIRLKRTILTLLVTLASLEARAEDTVDPKRRAAGLFVQGVRQFSEANFDEAARHFLEADALVPNSRALTNAISAARQSSNHLLVARAAQRALSRPGIEPETAALAREALADAARSLSRVDVRCAPEPCTVTLDGEPATPGVQYILPGTHDFSAVGPRGPRVTEHMSTAAGASYRVALWHASRPAPPDFDDPEPGPGALRDETPSRAKPLPPAAFWIGVAATAGMIGLTTWSGLDALSEKNAREPSGYSDTEREAIGDRARRTNYFLAGSAVLGGATAVAGIWFVDWGAKARAAVAPLPGGGVVVTTQGWF
jgi:hypothetical protein